MEQQFVPQQPQPQNQSNPLGLVGFILSLCALVFCWVPYLNWLLLIGALVLSIIGVTKQPKGLAIAGIIISGVVLVVYFLIIGLLLAIFV